MIENQKLYISLSVFIIAFIIFNVFFNLVVKTEGKQTGYITAIEKNGIIWHTGRVYIKTKLESSQEDFYCVKDDEIYNKLIELEKTKNEVTLSFKSDFLVPKWECDGELGNVYEIN